MVRVLSTMILTHISKASVRDCEHVGKALVRKFPLQTAIFALVIMPIEFMGSIHVCQMSKLQQKIYKCHKWAQAKQVDVIL